MNLRLTLAEPRTALEMVCPITTDCYLSAKYGVNPVGASSLTKTSLFNISSIKTSSKCTFVEFKVNSCLAFATFEHRIV